MQDLGLSDSQVFETWREEERAYLEGLAKEPMIETLEMEYYQKLNNLGASSSVDYLFRLTTTNDILQAISGGCTHIMACGHSRNHLLGYQG